MNIYYTMRCLTFWTHCHIIKKCFLSKNMLFYTKNLISGHLTNSSERVNVWRSVLRVAHQNDNKCLKKLILSSPSPKADATPVFGHRTYFYEKSQKYLRQCKITNVMKNTSKTKIHTQSNTDTDIRSQTYTILYHNWYSQSIVENIFTPEKV